MRKSYKKVISSILVLGFVVGGLAGCTTNEPLYNSNQLADAKSAAYLKGQASVVIPPKTICPTVTDPVCEVCPEAPAEDTLITEDVEAAQCEVDKSTAAGGYFLEDLQIGVETECTTLTDKQIDLIDGEVRFDNEDIDVEEYAIVCPIVGANLEEFKGQTHLQFPENGFVYGVAFGSELNTDEITEDKSLKFSFLGEKYEAIKWTEDKIRLLKGVEETLSVGGSIDVDGIKVTVGSIVSRIWART